MLTKRQIDFLYKYIEALRSGNYKQTRAALSRKENGVQCFCGMGVIGDLKIKEEPQLWEWREEKDSPQLLLYHLPAEKYNTLWLDNELLIEIGFEELKIGVGDGYSNIAYYNDKGWSFSQIADLVEEKLLNYLKEKETV